MKHATYSHFTDPSDLSEVIQGKRWNCNGIIFSDTILQKDKLTTLL